MMILRNSIAENEKEFSEKIFEDGLSIYEVIRIFRGHPIFLKDNLIRLDNSLKKSNFHIDPESLNIPEKLKQFIALENMQEGNLKYVLHFTTDHVDEYIFRIPHSYPTAHDYQEGVSTMTHSIMRENPGVKYVNPNLRTLSNQLMHENQVYEILLVDNEGYITEGSRSNVFFIKEQTLYTSPLEYVLPGTSRKRVFDICKEHGISVVEKRVSCDSISEYEVAFLTGTSPLILPVNRIDKTGYNTHHAFLQRLMQYYFALLEN